MSVSTTALRDTGEGFITAAQATAELCVRPNRMASLVFSSRFAPVTVGSILSPHSNRSSALLDESPFAMFADPVIIDPSVDEDHFVMGGASEGTLPDFNHTFVQFFEFPQGAYEWWTRMTAGARDEFAGGPCCTMKSDS
jgi:hypothetical protein